MQQVFNFFIILGIILFILSNNFNTFSISAQLCDYCCCVENTTNTCHNDIECSGYRHCNDNGYCEGEDRCNNMQGLEFCSNSFQCNIGDHSCIDPVEPQIDDSGINLLYYSGFILLFLACANCCSASNPRRSQIPQIIQNELLIPIAQDQTTEYEAWIQQGGISSGLPRPAGGGYVRRADSNEEDLDIIVFNNNGATDEEKTLILNNLNNNWKNYFINIYKKNNPSMPDPNDISILDIDYGSNTINLNQLYNDGIFNDQPITNLIVEQDFNNNDDVKRFRREFYGTDEILYIR